MPTIRRGAEAIEAAAERKSGNSDFKPFAPTIRWTQNGEEKYVLILTPIDETPVLKVHEFVNIGTRDNGKAIYGFYAYRKDSGIGESYDQLEDEFGIKPSERTFGVGVELEAEYEPGAKGRRPRIKRFKVATDSYDRKNEDGTTEEVTFPLVGVISQASGNFYNHVRSHDADYGPLNELPLKIKRIGTSTDTQYSLTPFMDQEIDLSNLIDYIDGISYISKDAREKIKSIDVPDEAAHAIAEAILDTRIEELTDPETYKEEVDPLDVIKGYTKTHHRSNGNSEESEPEVEPAEEEQEEQEDDDKDAAFNRIKQRAAAKAKK